MKQRLQKIFTALEGLQEKAKASSLLKTSEGDPTAKSLLETAETKLRANYKEAQTLNRLALKRILPPIGKIEPKHIEELLRTGRL